MNKIKKNQVLNSFSYSNQIHIFIFYIFFYHICATCFGMLYTPSSGRISNYDGRSESKERFVIQRYLLITVKKQNMQVLSHTFTYFST
jgi:hypothetical protein